MSLLKKPIGPSHQMSEKLTPEHEADVRSRVNPQYVNQRGTESHERAILLGEIDSLRIQLDNLRSHIHSCGPTCNQAGCVNARLRAEAIEECAALCEEDENRKVSGAYFAAAIRQLQRPAGEKEGKA